MASNYQFGRSKEDLLGDSPRYFYALRRTDDGELYFARVDQLSRVDSVQINAEGTSDSNFADFEQGVDFFEGRDVNHDLVYENLNYEQMRWDNKNLYYYIDDNGNLVVRIDTKYQYPSGI
jgi:hypothetical protein